MRRVCLLQQRLDTRVFRGGREPLRRLREMPKRHRVCISERGQNTSRNLLGSRLGFAYKFRSRKDQASLGKPFWLQNLSPIELVKTKVGKQESQEARILIDPQRKPQEPSKHGTSEGMSPSDPNLCAVTLKKLVQDVPKRLSCLITFMTLLIYFTTQPLKAEKDSGDSSACESAIAHVSRETGIPHNLLKAISLAETGRAVKGRMKPWPWSINHEGRTLVFESHQKMMHHVKHLLSQGVTRFDVGCMQINWHHHHALAKNPHALLEPLHNVRAAALLLLKHYKRSKSMAWAVGAYHSQTPHHMRRYLSQVRTFLERIPNV